MNFDLSEEQELFKATAQRFLAPIDVEARRTIRQSDGGYDRSRWLDMAELGLLALAAEESQGGMGGSIIDLAIIAESFGENVAVDPWIENGVLPIFMLAQARHEQLAQYLDGTKMAAVAFAEPATRYRLTPKTTVAQRDGDGFVLNGEKTFVLGGTVADNLIVTTKLDDETAFFLLPTDHEAIQIRGYNISDGSIAAQIFLRNAAVGADARLVLSQSDFEQIVAQMHLLTSAEMVGLGQRLLNDTLDYVKQREQFNASIGSFQVIQHGLTDAYIALEQMRSMMLRGLLMRDDDDAQSVAGVKSFISERAQFIAGRAVQYHGGMGITDELIIGHALKRLLLLSRLFGDTAQNLEIYARAA